MAKKIYVGVDNLARSVNTAYIGVNNIAKKVKKAYVGVGGKARLFYSEQPTNPVYYKTGLEYMYEHSRGGAVTNTEGDKIIIIDDFYAIGDGHYKAEMINKNRVKTELKNSDGLSYIGFANSKNHAVFAGGYNPVNKKYNNTSIAYSFSTGVKTTLLNIIYPTKGITGTGFNNCAYFGGGDPQTVATKAYYFRFDENLVYHSIENNVRSRSNGVSMAASNYGVFTCGGNAPDKDVANIRDKNFIRMNISGLPAAKLLHAAEAIGLLENIIMCGGSSSTSTSMGDLNNTTKTQDFLYSINKNFVATNIGTMTLSGCPYANTNKIMFVICPDPYNDSRKNTLEVYNSKLIRTHVLNEDVSIQPYPGKSSGYSDFYARYKCFLGDGIFFANNDDTSMAEVAFV